MMNELFAAGPSRDGPRDKFFVEGRGAVVATVNITPACGYSITKYEN
jgi:hypothetical protein